MDRSLDGGQRRPAGNDSASGLEATCPAKRRPRSSGSGSPGVRKLVKVLGHMENSYKLRELGPMKKPWLLLTPGGGGGVVC